MMESSETVVHCRHAYHDGLTLVTQTFAFYGVQYPHKPLDLYHQWKYLATRCGPLFRLANLNLDRNLDR